MTNHHTAQGLASLGRHGDSMLVHMSPHEVAGLNYLAKKQGTKLTINPETGLPEAFSLGGFFSSLLPVFAGAMVPGSWGAMAPLLAGAATGGALAAAKGENPLMGGLMGGLGGYSGAGLANSLGAAAAPGGGWYAGKEIAQTALPNAPGMADAGSMAYEVGGQGIAGNIGNPALSSAANTINQTGFANSALSGSGNIVDPALNRLSTAGTGLKNIATGQPGAWDAFKNAGGSGMKLAMPIGGAVLGGLEPTDIYGEPMKPDGKGKYDPYATLNLSNDTGLKLYAQGGIIANASSGTGISGLYETPDGLTTSNISKDGYGIGRLNTLASQESLNNAKTLGYAGGGPISFADGGDATKLSDELPAIDQSLNMASVTPTSIQPSMQGNQPPSSNMLNNAQAQIPSSDESIIAQVATKLQQDPNYRPQNPIEASILKQLKGTDNQQGQGIASLGPVQPSQPMAPTYNASQPIGPTYYAGLNAPKGFAEGGKTHLNLDQLPSLNVGDKFNSSNDVLKSMNSNDPIVQQWFRPGIEKMRAQESAIYGYTHGGYLDGAGDGMSDSIPATIEGEQPARLADGEFVVPADVVSHIGNGSSKAGSKRLYSMLDRVRKARTGHTKQGKQIKPEKYMPA